MTANTASTAIAALASLFLFTPVPSNSGIERSTRAALSRADGGPAVTAPTFRVPELIGVDLAITTPTLVFAGTLEPVTVPEGATEASAQATTAADARFRELPRGIGIQPAPTADIASPKAARRPVLSYVEEFPGAVAVSVPRLAANPKWRRVIEEKPETHPDTECANRSDEQCAASPWARWSDLVRKVSALGGEERLEAVNEGVNALLAYASDEEIYGVGDYWATLEESVARGRGDCEDIAIAKMWLLNATGVDLSSMRLVVLKDTLRNLDHAVLSVVENGHQYVLDNMTGKVGRADWMRGYRPIYALSAGQSWIYGMRLPQAPPLQVAQNITPQSTQ